MMLGPNCTKFSSLSLSLIWPCFLDLFIMLMKKFLVPGHHIAEIVLNFASLQDLILNQF